MLIRIEYIKRRMAYDREDEDFYGEKKKKKKKPQKKSRVKIKNIKNNELESKQSR